MNIKLNNFKYNLVILSISFLLLSSLIKISSWWTNINNNLVLKEISISNTNIINEKEWKSNTNNRH